MPMLPVLSLGSVGPYVKRLQMNLNGLALNYNKFAINGVFDMKKKMLCKIFRTDIN